MMRKIHLALLLSGVLLCLCACVDEPGSDQPAPEASKRFLKLRGYDFDVPAFFSAASAGDEIAVNGFLSAGIDANARDENGDTVLTAAAARGDLKIVNVLLSGGADPNAKGRNDWTALLLALEGERYEVAEALMKQPNLDLKAETNN